MQVHTGSTGCICSKWRQACVYFLMAPWNPLEIPGHVRVWSRLSPW